MRRISVLKLKTAVVVEYEGSFFSYRRILVPRWLNSKMPATDALSLHIVPQDIFPAGIEPPGFLQDSPLPKIEVSGNA